jgi:peptidoglycan/LPS O-acetylase OafA/YrhL
VHLPKWTRSWFVALAALLAAVSLATIDRHGAPTGYAHHMRNLFIQPVWGGAFFLIVNTAVRSEAKWANHPGIPRILAKLGLFSYSLYLTHELVLTHVVTALARWRGWSTEERTLLSIYVFVPICVGVAWLFFLAFERPFMKKATILGSEPRQVARGV